jgi:hypothetical protein
VWASIFETKLFYRLEESRQETYRISSLSFIRCIIGQEILQYTLILYPLHSTVSLPLFIAARIPLFSTMRFVGVMRLVGVLCARLVSAESVLTASGQGDTEVRLQKAQGGEPSSALQQCLYFTDEDFKTLAERKFRDEDGRKLGAKAKGGGIPPRANANQHHDMYSIEEYNMARSDDEVHGIGVENLQGSGKIASETSCACDDEMFTTIGYATGRCAYATQFQQGDNQAAWFFVVFLAFIYISSIIPTEKLLKKRRAIIGRATNVRLIPSNTYAKFRALKVLSAGLFILAGSVDAFPLDINSPLQRACIWEWEKESLTEAQQTCLTEKMRTSEPGKFLCMGFGQILIPVSILLTFRL